MGFSPSRQVRKDGIEMAKVKGKNLFKGQGYITLAMHQLIKVKETLRIAKT
jgi:hypothetical protein